MKSFKEDLGIEEKLRRYKADKGFCVRRIYESRSQQAA